MQPYDYSTALAEREPPTDNDVHAVFGALVRSVSWRLGSRHVIYPFIARQRSRTPLNPVACQGQGARLGTRLLVGALLPMALFCTPVWAQLRQPSQAGDGSPVQRARAAASTAEIMYLVTLGEMQVRAGEAGTGYALILEAAMKSGDPALFRRAVNIALESRSGSTAAEAANAWANALPTSPEPHRVLIQMLIGMDRVEDSASSLERMLVLTPTSERSELIDLVGQVYAQAKDAALAATVVSAKLRPWVLDPTTASSAHAAVARVQHAAGMPAQAGTSLSEALSQVPATPAAGLLAVEWIEHVTLGNEAALRQYIERHPALVDVRMAYVRFLLRASRWQDSEAQLVYLTSNTQQPPLPDAWLMLGALHLQLNRTGEAETSFKTYLSLIEQDASAGAASNRHARGKRQAYLSLAHIAERGQRLDDARNWLDQVDETDDALRIQTLRASLLAREGKLPEARLLIQNTPERLPGDALAKLKAEASLVKDAGLTADAYALLNRASALAPDDADLTYERALLAEKLGDTAEMERLLRSIIQAQPDNHNALNALGYSLADRNERLPEAKALIDKALSLAPDDPFITDSLGWVLFRMGNAKEAAVLLKKAFDTRPDVEIAVHLAEVLWTLGDRQAAMGYFNQARTLQPDSELLKSTLLRLQVKP